MGFRFILLALAVIAVVLIVRHLFRQRTAARPPRARSGEQMVKCAWCGVHVPRSEALGSGERFFCSSDHREASRADDR
jgi:uncharacterized protein